MLFLTLMPDRFLADRRQRNEQQRLAICDRAFAWLDVLGRQSGIHQAYLFGSLACPYRFIARSDVGLAVEAIDPERFFQAIAELSEQVEREVDLVELSKCLFADRIRQQGIVWSPKI